MSAWNQVFALLREGPESQLKTKFEAFSKKMDEALSLKRQLEMALEGSVTGNPKFAEANDAWKFIHEFREAGLGIDEAMNEYRRIINEFEKFSKQTDQDRLDAEAESKEAGGSHGSAFHRV